MAARMFSPLVGSLQKGVVFLFGTLILSTSGTIGTANTRKKSGFTVAKTGSEAGRYTVTFDDVYQALLWYDGKITGATDAAYTTAKGLGVLVRNVNIAAKTLDIQFVRTDTGADAEIEDSASIYLAFALSNSSV